MGEGLPTRAQWTAACRQAGAEPGVWRQAGDGGPFWTVRPLPAPRVSATVHGHAGDVTADVDDVLLRFSAGVVERINGLDIDGLHDAFEAIFGTQLLVVDRGGLHARSPYGWVHAWAHAWADVDTGPPQNADLAPGMMVHGWRATRWRDRLLLIVWGGEPGARVAAPAGTMTLDWRPHRPHIATVQPLAVWDRVTAALLEASASGGDPLTAAVDAAADLELEPDDG